MSDGAPWSEINESAQHDLVARNADPKFIILYNGQCCGDCAIFWRPDRKGYTTRFNEAGQYSEAEAMEIYEGRHGSDMPVPLEEAAKMVQSHIGFDAAREAARAYLTTKGA